MSKGYATRTYQVRLYDRHMEWLKKTRDIYQAAVMHYYQILTEHPELREHSTFVLLRVLEELTVGTKEGKAAGKTAEYPLDEALKKICGVKDCKMPLYFRRAAINTAIGMARSHDGQLLSWEKNGFSGEKPGKPEEFYASPLFYKGMYRELTTASIQLKLFNGSRWIWVTYPFAGRQFPNGADYLSPTLVFHKKDAYLHIPVRTEVEDIRTVEERMRTERCICAVSVPDGYDTGITNTAYSDIFAVCVILDRNGTVIDSRFFYGVRRWKAQREALIGRLEKSRTSRNSTVVKGKTGENETVYQKLRQLNHYYTHKTSHDIVEYCLQREVKVIAIPNFGNVAKNRHNPFGWIGRGILNQLDDKAFREGIVVTGVRAYRAKGGTEAVASQVKGGTEEVVYQAESETTSQAKSEAVTYQMSGEAVASQVKGKIATYQTEREKDIKNKIWREEEATIQAGSGDKASIQLQQVKQPYSSRNAGNEALAAAINLGRYFLTLFPTED